MNHIPVHVRRDIQALIHIDIGFHGQQADITVEIQQLLQQQGKFTGEVDAVTLADAHQVHHYFIHFMLINGHHVTGLHVHFRQYPIHTGVQLFNILGQVFGVYFRIRHADTEHGFGHF